MKEYTVNTITFYPTHILMDRSHDFIKNISPNVIQNGELYNKIISTYSKSLGRISNFNLNNLFVSLVGSDSIFFRFTSIDNCYEFKLEAFLEYNDNDESDIEATLHVYKNGMKEKSLFGGIDYLCDIVSKLLTEPLYEIVPNYGFKKIYKEDSVNMPTVQQIPNSFIAIQESTNYTTPRFRQYTLSGEMG